MFDQPPAIVIPPVPPFVSVARAADPSTTLIAYRPGTVRCAGVAVPFARRIDPFVAATSRFPGGDSVKAGRVTLRFRIDASGRPLSITRPSPSPDAPGFYADSSDLEPSLAVSRFAPAERVDCEVTYDREAIPLAQAGSDLLYAAFDSPLLRPYLRRVYARFAPAGADCVLNRLRPRVLVYPDLEQFRDRPERSGALFAFDVTRDGRTTNLRLLRSTNAGIAREIRTAIEGTRYFQGARVEGCVIGFTVGARQAQDEQLLPPPPNDKSAPKSCPTLPAPVRPINVGPFPEPFARRNVEGHAIVRYDVASWGAVGNVRVEASEPAEAFGQRAASAVRALTFPSSPEGKRDCSIRVVFRLEQ